MKDDVDIDLEANRAGGRETAGADLYITSISEPGRGGVIPESNEFGSPGGGASKLSLLPPSGGGKPSLLALQMKAPKNMILLYFIGKSSVKAIFLPELRELQKAVGVDVDLDAGGAGGANAIEPIAQ